MVIFGGMDIRKLKYSTDVFTLDTYTLMWTREETSGITVNKKECRTAAILGNCIRTLYQRSKLLLNDHAGDDTSLYLPIAQAKLAEPSRNMRSLITA